MSLKDHEDKMKKLLDDQKNEKTRKNIKRAAKKLSSNAAKKRATSPNSQVNTRSKAAN